MPEFGRAEMPGVALYEMLPLLDSSDMVRHCVLSRCVCAIASCPVVCVCCTC